MKTAEQIEEIEQETPKTQDQQKGIEATFTKSGIKQFDGVILQPYSASREAAADSMGVKYGSVSEDEGKSFTKTGLYPGMKRDIWIVMWLCARATEEEIDMAGADGYAGARKAMEWAREVGLQDTASKKFSDAYDLFIQIMHETWVNRTKPEKKSPAYSESKK